MRSVPAIVESATAQAELAIGNAWHALRLAEQRAAKTAERSAAAQKADASAQDEARRARVDMGRALIAAKAECRHGQWLPMLKRIGIGDDSALRYMALAGYVKSRTDGDVRDLPAPTYAEAGIDKRPRVGDDAQDDDEPVPSARPDRSGGRGKPAWLMRAIVRHYTMPGDLVCDPLAGWGSTLHAALDEGRTAVGAEIDPGIAAAAGELDIRVGDWRDVLAGLSVDAIITDPPYSARTHEASRKFGNERADGSPLDGLGPDYAAWTPEHVWGFVKEWSPRCRGWMVALTDHHLIPHWQGAYEEADRYSFAPVVCLIRGMTVRLCGDGPSSWAIYAMVSRPRSMSRWNTLPGGYVGSRDRLEAEGDA